MEDLVNILMGLCIAGYIGYILFSSDKKEKRDGDDFTDVDC